MKPASLTSLLAAALAAAFVGSSADARSGGSLRRAQRRGGKEGPGSAVGLGGVEHAGERDPDGREREGRRLPHESSPSPPAPPSWSPPPSSDPPFHVRLHWTYEGFWQETHDEVEWCWSCYGPSCDVGEQVKIEWCDPRIDTQKFRYVPDADRGDDFGRFVADGTSPELCPTRIKGQKWYHLEPCDEQNTYQLLEGFDQDETFELHPYGGPSGKDERCLQTEHHPKEAEHVYAGMCSTARKYLTSLWEVYHPPPVEGIDFTEADCESGKCPECHGDCDYDHHCATGLRCFHRYSHESVPGCFGAGRFGGDYCYREPGEGGPPGGGGNGGGGGGHGLSAGKQVKIVKGERCETWAQCGECEGDCNWDGECQTGLKCHHRTYDGNPPVPGCSGTPVMGKDYCVRAQQSPPGDCPAGIANGSEDCRTRPDCCPAGKTCYEKNKWWASCKPIAAAAATTTTAAAAAATTTTTAASDQRAQQNPPIDCAAGIMNGSDDCRNRPDCCPAGHKCYEKNKWWASCRASCQQGETDTWDKLPWGCTILT